MLELIDNDIIIQILRYIPAECIMLYTMSKKLREAVLKTGFSVKLMQLFFINSYGYIWSFRYRNFGEENITNIFIDHYRPLIKDIVDTYFGDELLCYIYSFGYKINYIPSKIPVEKFAKKCYEKNDLISFTALFSSEKIAYYLKELMLINSIKYNPSTWYLSDISFEHKIKYIFKRGLSIDDRLKLEDNHQVYLALKYGYNDLASKVWNKLDWHDQLTEVIKSIKNDKINIFVKFVEMFKFDVSSINIRNSIYEYDAVKIFGYVMKFKDIICVGDFSIPKIAKYIVENNMMISFNFDCNLLSYNRLKYYELFIPDSYTYRSAITLNYMLQARKVEPIKILYNSDIEYIHELLSFTPHSNMVINQLFDKLVKLF